MSSSYATTEPTTYAEGPDEFDRQLGTLHGLPDAVEIANTVHIVEPIVGNAKTFIVRRVRQSEQGDTVFLHVVSKKENVRLVLPPKVMALLTRQDGVLSTKLRRQNGKRLAAERKAQGIVPAFLRTKKKGRR